MYTMAEFLIIMCIHGTCMKSDNVVQIPVSPAIVSYTRGPEHMPRVWYEGTLYILVPETGV
jgi:hypothetical protein